MHVPNLIGTLVPMIGKQKERARNGEALRTIRELRGLTADELAQELGISRPYLSNIENGRKNLTPQLALQAADVLKVRPIVLVNEDFLRKDLEAGAGP